MGAALHVVQVSRDVDLIAPNADAEPLQRQLDYARELATRAPGAIVSIIVLGGRTCALPHERANLRVMSVRWSLRGVLQCTRMIHHLHKQAPVSVITTQVPYDEAWFALALGRWHGIPVIGQVHSELFTTARATTSVKRVLRTIRNWATRRTLRYFDALRTVSSESSTSVARFAHGIPVATIPVPVPMVESATRGGAAPPDRPRIVFVGRLAPEKDLDSWLEIAAAVSRVRPDVQFEIVGDGPERARLESAAARLNLQGALSFAGFVPYDRLQEIYARATALMLTSREEGFGRVLVEAASQGTPVVSTDVAGPRDIVINGVTGFLHEPGDVAGFSRSVGLLVSQPQRAAAMGASARTLVALRFNPRTLRAAWVDLWMTTAAAGRSAS
jgi:glycosyltransferase involved in cell wall biosynthesis